MVTAVSGKCPDLTFTVSGSRVVTDKSTDYKKSDCKDVRADRSVTVEGNRQPDGTVRATRIEVKKD
jgi:hypothetical protein